MKKTILISIASLSALTSLGCQKNKVASESKSTLPSEEQVAAKTESEKEFEQNAIALFSGARTQLGFKSGTMSNGEQAACFYYATNLQGQDPASYYKQDETRRPTEKKSISPMIPFAMRLQKNTYKQLFEKALSEEKVLKSAQVYHSAVGGLQTAAGVTFAVLGAAALASSGLPMAIPAELASLNLMPVGAVMEFLALSGQLGAGVSFLDARSANKKIERLDFRFSSLSRKEKQAVRIHSDLAYQAAQNAGYDLWSDIPPIVSEAMARSILAHPKSELTQISCANSDEVTQFKK